MSKIPINRKIPGKLPTTTKIPLQGNGMAAISKRWLNVKYQATKLKQTNFNGQILTQKFYRQNICDTKGNLQKLNNKLRSGWIIGSNIHGVLLYSK